MTRYLQLFGLLLLMLVSEISFAHRDTTSASGLRHPPGRPVGPIDLRPPELPNIFTELNVDGRPLVEKIKAVEREVCDRTCGSEFPSDNLSFSSEVCQPCQCDVTCVHDHTCCADVILDKKVKYSGLGSDCVRLTPTRIDTDFLGQDMFSSMTTKCYSRFNGKVQKKIPMQETKNKSVLRFKCERPDLSKPDEALPVSDNRTKLTYRNVYCAKCNDVDKRFTTTWRVNVTCEKTAELLLTRPIHNEMKLFEILSQKSEVERTGCWMTYFPEDTNKYRRRCRQANWQMVTYCNRTGNWGHYNADILKACHMYTSVYTPPRDKSVSYRNVFCFICNTFRRSSLYDLINIKGPGGSFAGVGFSALFDFSIHDNDEKESVKKMVVQRRLESPCNRTQVFDNTTCSCLEMECSGWRSLNAERKTCHSAIDSTYLEYQGRVKVSVDFASAPSAKEIDTLPNWFADIETNHSLAVTILNWCPCISTIHINVDVVITESEATKDSGNSAEEIFHYYGRKMCDVIFSGHSVNGLQLISIESCRFTSVKDHLEDPDYCPSCVNIESHRWVGHTFEFSTKEVKETAFWGRSKNRITLLPYKPMEHCVLVEIPATYFNESYGMLVNIQSGQNISKSKVSFIQNDTAVRLCIGDYFQWTNGSSSQCGIRTDLLSKSKSRSISDVWTTEGLISIITSCISLLFLFLTFLTYILFDQLRAKGYGGIMVLTSTLFMSQALFEFTIEQYENETLCYIFGMLIHYFWLAAVFSMNACTVERFATLCFPLASRSFFMSRKPFVVATLYTFITPLIVVICNIIVSLVTRDNLGYGKYGICHLNERYALIVFFILPIILICLINFILLIITIVKLRRQSLPGERNKLSHARVGFMACARLSGVTGVLWFIYLLSVFMPVAVIGLLFAMLFGLQGVILFFSLFGNKRVFKLYKDSLTPKSWKNSDTSGSGNTTATKHTTQGNKGNTCNANLKIDSYRGNSNTRSTESAETTL